MNTKNNNVKTKSKSIIGKIVFSRRIITIILLLVQIFILFAIFKWLGNYMHFIYGGISVLSLVLITYILNNRSNPAFKLAWVIPICMLPVIGVLLYIFINWNFGEKKLNFKLEYMRKQLDSYSKTNKEIKEKIYEDDGIKNISYYLENVAHNPSFMGGDITYYPLGENKFHDMLIELEKAEKFIFLEYFIVEEGKMWDSILEILKRKAKQGVEVRVMYDGMGSLVLLPYNYPEKLKEMGIKAKVYSPIKPFLSTDQNNRDHRKILIVDGKVAFNGGVNLADEYINAKVVHGHWKDVAIRIKGQAVLGYTNMFLQMWGIESSEEDDYEKYLLDNKNDSKDESIIIPYGDGPINKENIAENVYMDILYTAKKYVHITTPYLIMDNEMVTALTYAAERGVDVKLILPHISDSKASFNIARTYYPQLIESGVKVYEYTPGFVHAKVFVSDDVKAVVGTINMDYRSLYHHFECGTYIYKNKVIHDIEKDYNDTVTKCKQITMKDYCDISILSKIHGKIFRIFGYLM